MGAISTGSVNFSTLINQENALAAYKGLDLNRYWTSWVGWDNHLIYQNGVSFSPYAAWITYQLHKGLFATFNQVEQILSPEKVTSLGAPDIKKYCYYAVSTLVALNGAKVFKDYWSGSIETDPLQKQPVKEGIMSTVLVVVWKATPYLMIITNMAMTLIQIQRGDTSAWATLAFAGITLIDLTTLSRSTNYQWYRMVVLEGSVAAVAFYYSNNTNRLNIIRYSAPKIIYPIALTNQTVYQIMKKPISKFLLDLQNDLGQFPIIEIRLIVRKTLTKARAELANTENSSLLELITKI